MPEMKRNFTGGKMNKDLDERVVPNGQYRDAMNIQVSTSEGSDIGTIQNILGNAEIQANFSIDPSAVCVGSIADEKNDKLYWFTKSNVHDRIIEYNIKTNSITPVLTFPPILFSPATPLYGTISESPMITGINIIDDLLFWTDGVTEPKKINISRSIAGTDSLGVINTKIINEFQNLGANPWLMNEHLAVIKRGPKKPLKLNFEIGTDSEADAYIFKEKFVRFSYRYKYLDGEYSPFAPFSNIAFAPGPFEYKPKKGYNTCMSNRIIKLTLFEFITNDLPKDVEAIDLLIKMEESPTVYIVDTIKQNDVVPSAATHNPWNLNEYIIDSDNSIKGAIPSNQMLRPWDNVPKRALGQEITGNRLIYGNYTQGYNLLNNSGTNYRPEFTVNIDGQVGNTGIPGKSIKSLRDYQLGVVFSDYYGRETPVISNQSGNFNIPKGNADKNNVLNVMFDELEHPEDMKYYKFFIKETSSQYYNIAMDRYYIDGDGNIWVSFPSSDRNKVDLDTVLILKKAIEGDDLVTAKASYKILAIENEAPDFIKIEKFAIEDKSHAFGTNDDIFGDGLTDAPLEGYDSFKMNYLPFSDSSGSDLHKITDGELYIEFGLLASDEVSERYKISKITCDVDGGGVALEDANYSIKLTTTLGVDVNFITDDDSGHSPTKILDYTSVTIYKYTAIKGANFEGRFFVKIEASGTFSSEIQVATSVYTTVEKYSIRGTKKLYFMNNDHNTKGGDSLGGHDSLVTGLDNGAYDTESQALNAAGGLWHNFSKFAVYFRNYKYPNDEVSDMIENENSITSFAGKYKFGLLADEFWKTEFLD